MLERWKSLDTSKLPIPNPKEHQRNAIGPSRFQNGFTFKLAGRVIGVRWADLEDRDHLIDALWIPSGEICEDEPDTVFDVLKKEGYYHGYEQGILLLRHQDLAYVLRHLEYIIIRKARKKTPYFLGTVVELDKKTTLLMGPTASEYFWANRKDDSRYVAGPFLDISPSGRLHCQHQGSLYGVKEDKTIRSWREPGARAIRSIDCVVFTDALPQGTPAKEFTPGEATQEAFRFFRDTNLDYPKAIRGLASLFSSVQNLKGLPS